MNEDDKRLAESKRILRQVDRDSDQPGFRGVHKLEEHFSAKDADANDPIEVWGTRIGRGLGLVIMMSLLLTVILWFGAAQP
ncbi:MAG: hypothetical protein ACRCU5_01110 [Rhizobiaceae bacterium]